MMFLESKQKNTPTFYHLTKEPAWASLFTIILLLFVGYLLSLYPVSEPSLNELKQLYVPWYADHLSPKPKERFIYTRLLLLLPLLNLLAIALSIAISKKFKLPVYVESSIFLITPLFITIPLLLYLDPFETISFAVILLGNFARNKTFLIIAALITIGLFLNYVYYSRKKNLSYFVPSQPFYLKLGTAIFNLIILGMIILQSFSFRIVDASIVSEWPHHVHFNAAFYVVTQVASGKILLSDLPAQYGLYAEFLKPLFSIIGLSVYNLTLVMGLLQITALVCLFLTLSQYIKNKSIIFICIMSLCFFTGFTFSKIQGHYDPYYQYFPLRFFFPAISIFLFSILIRHKKLYFTEIILFSFLCGVSLLWNLDTGVPILGAFLSYLCSLILFPTKDISRIAALKRLLVSVLSVITFIFLFWGYLSIKANSPLNLGDLLKYQYIFYMAGFFMLPIAKGFAHWQIFCGIYIAGLTIALYSWLKGSRSTRGDLFFYLSILGLGLFSYYSGRSHPRVLICCTWPAFIVAFIMMDTLFRLVKAKKLPYLFAAPGIPVLFFGVVLTGCLISATPMLYKSAQVHWSRILQAQASPTPITENILFIVSKTMADKEAIMLTDLQSLYYAETRLASPIQGPGLGEMILQHDWDNMVQAIMQCHKHLFVQLDNGELPDRYQFILKKYQLIDKTSTLAYFSGCHL